MSFEWLIGILVGGGGAAGILSAFFTRKSSKEKTDIDLLDRAYKEIERLDDRLTKVKVELKLEKNENVRLQDLIKSIERQVVKQKKIIIELKGGKK